MNGSIQAAGSSMDALGKCYRVITHNLANANTVGYKRRAESIRQSLAGQTTGETGGEVTSRPFIDFSQGRLIHTGRALDVALGGKNAFFVIETPKGQMYTRNGVFRLNDQGQMVDSSGQSVAGQSGPLTVPANVGPDAVSISSDGRISANGQSLGQFKIVQFDKPELLVPIGKNRFSAPKSAAPKQTEKPGVHQRFQEGSNVSVVKELVDLITVTRLYEANAKSIKAHDERMKNILQVAMG